MKNIMTQVELEQARSALIRWFISQDISPSNGSLIMIACIAEQLTAKTKDIDELQKGIKSATAILILEVADFIRK